MFDYDIYDQEIEKISDRFEALKSYGYWKIPCYHCNEKYAYAYFFNIESMCENCRQRRDKIRKYVTKGLLA